MLHIEGMAALVHTAALAMRLAGRDQGVTVGELSRFAGCSPRAAQWALATLARAGILAVVVPGRKGKRRGDWRNTYTLPEEDKEGVAENGRPDEQKGKERRRACCVPTRIRRRATARAIVEPTLDSI